MADSTYQPLVHRKQGGSELVVASGGKITADAGGKIVRNLATATLTTVGNETYTAAQLAGGVIVRDPNGAARTDTTDTAAALIAAMKLEADGESALCYLINTADAAEAITLAGGSGVTISNVAQTVAQNESAVLLFVRTSASAVSLHIIGA